MLETLLGSLAGFGIALLFWIALPKATRDKIESGSVGRPPIPRDIELPPSQSPPSDDDLRELLMHTPPSLELKDKPHTAAAVGKPKSARIYISNENQLCAFGPKPSAVDPSWLAFEDKGGKGLFGITPYALGELRAAYALSGIDVNISPQAENRGKRAQIVRSNTLRVHDHKLMAEEPLANGHELRDYQKIAVAFCDATQGRFILGDVMGLGKTVVSIACRRRLNADKALVVAKSSIKYKWQDAAREFDGSTDTYVMEGTTPKPIPKGTRWLIGNYDILPHWLEEIQKWNPELVVLDEAHYIANPEALRSQAAKRLAVDAPYFIALSGTPIRNRPRDFWNLLDAAQPGWWGSQKQYEIAFCKGRLKAIPKRGRKGRITAKYVWDAKGISNESALHERVKSVMLRREKSEANLPPQSRSVLRVDLTRAARVEYRQEHGRMMEALKAKDQRPVLNHIMKLRQISSQGRIHATVDRALELVKKEERPVVIFTYFHAALNLIEAALAKEKLRVARIDGNVSAPKRHEISSKFQAGGFDVVVAQVEAGGEGIDLYRSDTTFHHDVTWTPFQQAQAESRVHRIGQTKPTNHLYFLGKDTIDEKIMDMTMKKLQMSKSVLDSGEKIDADVMRALRKKHFKVEV